MKLEKEFICPTEIVGKTKKKVILELEKKSGIKFVKKVDEFEGPNSTPNVWLWNKISDPDLNPNDYLRIEDEQVEIKWVITTCMGIIAIEDVFKKFMAEKKKNVERYTLNPDQVQLKSVLNKLRIKYCSNSKNKRICCKRHFFVGVGVYKKHFGIHIILYPEFNKNQKDSKNNNHLNTIKDDIYQSHLRWLKMNSKPTKKEILDEKLRLVKEYNKEIRRCLSQIP